MSDEPKKRSRGGWIGWAAFLLLVLYPLSYGPCIWFRESNPLSFETMVAIYFPLGWVADHCKPIGRVFDWYARLYGP
jgi:hypothetical protein